MSPGREPAYEPGHDKMYRPPDDRNRGSSGGSGGGGGDQVSLEDLLQRLRNALPSFGGGGGGGASGGIVGLIILGGLVIILLVWLASGIYTVNPDEQAALRTFGRFTSIQDPGLHWHWPSPIGERNVVAVTQTRRME
ncbi:MAG: protease modulator HflK, partial [Chloroflexota bacterium]